MGQNCCGYRLASLSSPAERMTENIRQKAGLNRTILDKGWGEIRHQLDYKCRWYGSSLESVNPAYTSQECSKCHHAEVRNR